MIRIEYIENNKNTAEYFETFEEVDFFVKEHSLIEVSNPENEKEYRLTN